MKAKLSWIGFGLLAAVAAAQGAEGLWLGEDDRVAVVAKTAGAEWAEASGVLMECAELEIPLALFHGTLTEEEREATEAAFPGEPGMGEVTETGARFEGLGERLEVFDPSHVILAGWKAGEGVPPGVAEALEETPATILLAGVKRGDCEMALADFQKEVRDAVLPSFGLAPSRKSVEYFRVAEADEIPVAADEPAAAEPAGRPTAPSAPAEERVEPETARAETGGVPAKLRPRTSLPSAPRAKAWFEMPAGW
jgi:hypothetical protein